MKRGLVAAAGADTPVYEARLERLREQVRDMGAVAALVYGDVYRSDDIAHLTNLCIYWNEGVLAVPADGPPAFLAKLSARVHPWMRRTSILEDLRASQRLPELIASYLDELGPGPVAFVEEDWWPGELAAGIEAAASERGSVTLGDAVRRTRLAPDTRDLDDLRRAGEIVAGALAAAESAADGEDANARIAAIERAARGEGARDVLAFAAPAAGDGGALTVELTVQFANVWASAARTFGGDGSADSALTSVIESLRSGMPVPDGVGVKVVHHCDLATAGDLRPAADAAQPLSDGAVVAVTVRAENGEVAGDTLRIAADGASALTIPTLETA